MLYPPPSPLLPVCSCFQHCKSMLFCSLKARMQINCQYFTTHIFHSVNIIGFTQEDYFLFSATQGWENRGSQRLFSRLTTLWDADVEPMKKTRMRNIISWRPEQSHPLLCLKHLLLLSFCRCHFVNKQPHSPSGDSKLGQCSKTIEASCGTWLPSKSAYTALKKWIHNSR